MGEILYNNNSCQKSDTSGAKLTTHSVFESFFEGPERGGQRGREIKQTAKEFQI